MFILLKLAISVKAPAAARTQLGMAGPENHYSAAQRTTQFPWKERRLAQLLLLDENCALESNVPPKLHID